MYYDPYDEDVQVKFHRTDPTGRTVPLDVVDSTRMEVFRVACAVVAIAALTAIVLCWWFA